MCTALATPSVDALALSVTRIGLWGWWVSTNALLAFTAIVSPGMGVLSKLDESQRGLPIISIGTTIAVARSELHIFKAARFTSFRAAIADATNLGCVVELCIVLAMEFRTTHWREWGTNERSRRDLEIDVKVLSASHFRLTVFMVPVLCENTITIHVTVIRSVPEEELIMELTERMGLHFNRNIPIGPLNLLAHRPFVAVVNFGADFGAVFVVLLTGNIDASF